MKDWVFSYLTFTVLHRRPIVKRIQAGFLADGSSYLARNLPFTAGLLAPSHPAPSTCSRIRVVDLASFVPVYSGVAVPDSHGVPFSAYSHLNANQILLTPYHSF
jgi:hypothetical protein